MGFEILDHDGPCKEESHSFHGNKEPFTLLNDGLHDGIELDDEPSFVKDGGYYEINKSNSDERENRSGWKSFFP